MYNTKENNITDDEEDLIDDSILGEFETTGFTDFHTSNRLNSNVNKSINNQDTSDLNVSALCCDIEYSGFDKLTGQKWIYPNNYQERPYQFNIIQASLYKNTLVSLPTGLGKTFIAAVLMYNFYLWYPTGKIIFTAPMKPLIKQQIKACYKINALPPEDTIEMTGDMKVNLRKENWEKKRVFFATPQIVSNDLSSGICPWEKIRCLVIDEAHRAKNNYAYCNIVSTLTERKHRTYRILALTATPGSRIKDVIQVVKNLHIAHLELRTEDSIDVKPYCQLRNINQVLIPLGPELSELHRKYIEILDTYTRKLIQLNILKSNNIGNISRGRIFMIYKEFKSNSNSHPQHRYIMRTLSQLLSLYHALDLLVINGSRAFLHFFLERTDISWIESDSKLVAMKTELQDTLGVDPLNTTVQTDGTIPKILTDIDFGHPKFTKLKEIMEEHFKRAQKKNEDTRAIVFCEYYVTVKLVRCLLLQCHPLIKPRIFVGQGSVGGRAGMTQGEQAAVMNQFREGVACNVLVATCVAEEGLDVGSVDLIVCFDVASRSPVRLVQRCGRTGRERTGQVYFLVTEGKEQQTLQEGMRQRDSLRSTILQSKEVQASLYALNPRLIPPDITPRLEKMFITVETTSNGKRGQDDQGKTNKKKNKKKSLQIAEPSVSESSQNKKQNIPITLFLSPKKEDSKKPSFPSLSLKESPLKTKIKDKTKRHTKSNLKNVDIRALFLGTQKSKQVGVKAVTELFNENAHMSTQTLNLFVDLTIQAKTANPCYICESICNCQTIQDVRKRFRENCSSITKYKGNLTFPNIELIDQFNIESILECAKSDLTKEAVNEQKVESIDDIHNDSFYPTQHYFPEDNNTEDHKDHKESTIKREYITSHFDIGDADDLFDLSPQEEKAIRANEQIHGDYTIPSVNFDLGCVDDFLNEGFENDEVKQFEENNLSDIKKPVVSDIPTIDLSCDSPEPVKNSEPAQFTSPSILSGARKTNFKSPIVKSLSQKMKLKRKSGNPANCTSTSNTPLSARKKLSLEPESPVDLSNSMLSITQTIDLINSEEVEYVTSQNDNERCSPVLLTQADKKKKVLNNNGTNNGTKETQNNVDISSLHIASTSTLIIKRKAENDHGTESPYFIKKPKLNYNNESIHNTDQDKISAVVTSNNNLNIEKKYFKSPVKVNCSAPVHELDVKANEISNKIDGYRESNSDILSFIEKFSYTPKKSQQIQRKPLQYETKQNPIGNKLRIKKKKRNSFIESEAEMSEDGYDGSGDEMTDDSVGSIADFITDKDVTPTKEDMEAHYLKSVKSPFKPGAFKIPQLPPQRRRSEVFSQYVEDDSYEMDSFCVDSHVGLTQDNYLSRLELAEMILEENRKRKKNTKTQTSPDDNRSPEIIRPCKYKRRNNVISDSDDSS